MLSYQHAYHAGGPADLHKHAALAALLARLTAKDRGVTYMETHAGRALYDLSGAEAAKTGEAAAGIGRLEGLPPSPFHDAVMSARAANGPSAYPGSPAIAAHLLRKQDRIVLMEKHPQEASALKRAMKTTGAEVHARDGYEGVLAVSPPKPRRGLVLIDPSYEVKDEYGRVADFVPQLAAKWPEAAILVWYPLLPTGRHEAMASALEGAGAARHEVGFEPLRPGGMEGSGLVLWNPPFGAAADLGAGRILAPQVLSA
ncbi:23S rRNA (adenine(2030)-N(6))-methyltransferase RlmJ [Parvularcula dongshanensis]|uniref:Ribosomal RNA large subunit methyltransferase J n=1 Tax=Parvularcula dongshanensis TaxID=1173995 RepID=A0A840I4V5_9PROT|nr:23S rRNA (adenine(2030)-N(6))-methyltransferase RlmJ [Parvularcula dongshanensis]MBB4659365.1 23S rRNA (adenine2030-N6)-methyltransferase [Parvularcula dongshanensis]